KDRRNRRWYVNSEGQTLAVIEGPVEFLMGSPVSEPDRHSLETPHRQPINRRFAIATKEVTVEQYQRFLKVNSKIAPLEIDRYSPEPTGPMNGMTWYEAAAYCNWLISRHERLVALHDVLNSQLIGERDSGRSCQLAADCRGIPPKQAGELRLAASAVFVVQRVAQMARSSAGVIPSRIAPASARKRSRPGGFATAVTSGLPA